MYLNALVFTACLSPSNSWRAADEWGKQEEIKGEIFESGFQGHLYWLGLRAHLPPSLRGAPEAPQSFHLFTHTSTRDASSEGLPCLRLLGGSGMQTSSLLEPSSTAPHRLHSQGLGQHCLDLSFLQAAPTSKSHTWVKVWVFGCFSTDLEAQSYYWHLLDRGGSGRGAQNTKGRGNAHNREEQM